MDTNEIYQEICNLTAELQSTNSPIGDWKIAKYQEYVIAGLEPPYDINELHTKRQEIRDRINELRESMMLRESLTN